MSEIKKIFSPFKPASLSDWVAAARHELDGANPLEKLAHKKGGMVIQPYYDENNGEVLLQPSSNSFLGPRAWYNCPRIIVRQEETANQIALEHLKNGADGILFELSGPTNFKNAVSGESPGNMLLSIFHFPAMNPGWPGRLLHFCSRKIR